MSPELALVDAALAAQLRAIDVQAPEPSVVAAVLVDTVAEEAALEAVEPSVEAPVLEVVVNDPLADLIVQEPEHAVSAPPVFDAPDDDPSADLIVEETDRRAETSWYPALPAPVDQGPEPMDATETALREIRERLATPGHARRKRRFRKRFTVASGLSTLVALGVFAANVSYGVAQLPI